MNPLDKEINSLGEKERLLSGSLSQLTKETELTSQEIENLKAQIMSTEKEELLALKRSEISKTTSELIETVHSFEILKHKVPSLEERKKANKALLENMCFLNDLQPFQKIGKEVQMKTKDIVSFSKDLESQKERLTETIDENLGEKRENMEDLMRLLIENFAYKWKEEYLLSVLFQNMALCDQPEAFRKKHGPSINIFYFEPGEFLDFKEWICEKEDLSPEIQKKVILMEAQVLDVLEFLKKETDYLTKIDWNLIPKALGLAVDYEQKQELRSAFNEAQSLYHFSKEVSCLFEGILAKYAKMKIFSQFQKDWEKFEDVVKRMFIADYSQQGVPRILKDMSQWNQDDFKTLINEIESDGIEEKDTEIIIPKEGYKKQGIQFPKGQGKDRDTKSEREKVKNQIDVITNKNQKLYHDLLDHDAKLAGFVRENLQPHSALLSLQRILKSKLIAQDLDGEIFALNKKIGDTEAKKLSFEKSLDVLKENEIVLAQEYVKFLNDKEKLKKLEAAIKKSEELIEKRYVLEEKIIEVNEKRMALLLQSV